MQEICLRADLADQIPAQAMRSLEELERALYQLRGQEKALGVSCLFQIDDALALQAETLTNQDLMRLRSIGACFATFPLASSMGIRQEPYWNEALGQVSLPWRDDAWLPYLTMMNRWHRDGILQYTWEELTSRAVSFEPGLVFAQGLISFRPDWQGASAVLNQNLRASQQGGRTGSDGLSYRPLPQPLTYQGDYQAVAADYGQPRFGLYITQRCRNPQRAASFAAYLRSAEGARLTQWGVEGKHYPENVEGGRTTFSNGDITYCEAHHNMAIFYAQTDDPILSVEVIPIGKVTSDLAAFEELPNHVNVTFALAEES